MKSSRKPTILIIVSNDFGELAYAYDFIYPLIDSYRIEIALPQHIYIHNHNKLGLKCHQYTSGNDIQNIYIRKQPEIVFFFSAFLLVPNNIFTIKSFKTFIRQLNLDKKTIISSDPFLGMLGSFYLSDIKLDVIKPTGNKLIKFFIRYLTWQRFRKIYRIMEGIHCIVPFGLEQMENKSNYHAYFNNTPVQYNTVPQCNYWAFVISELDYHIQKSHHKQEKFIELLSKKLQETQKLGYLSMLIAPIELIDKIKPLASRTQFIHRCNILEHKALIYNADRVFYWNMISHSVYHRLTHYKSLYFFDRGHTYQLFPRLHQKAMSCYYHNNEPSLIHFDKPLDIEILNKNTEKLYKGLGDSITKLRSLPTSEELIQKLENYNT
jgi:hypothetical protein